MGLRASGQGFFKSNLINNAVESYGVSGGLVLVSLEVEHENCLLSVRDYGSGIPKEYLDRLGKEQITFKGDTGRGVGLMHAFSVVSKYSGSCKIDSEVGVGTKISICLPTVGAKNNFFENANEAQL